MAETVCDNSKDRGLCTASQDKTSQNEDNVCSANILKLYEKMDVVDLVTQQLLWVPKGALYQEIHDSLGKQGSIEQKLADETPEEVLEELRLLCGKHSRAALSAQPVVRVLLAGSDERQIKPLSAILRWLRGNQCDRLVEYDAAGDSLPLYLDFVAQAGVRHCVSL